MARATAASSLSWLDQEADLVERLVVLGRVGAEPDGPERALGHGPHDGVAVAHRPAEGRIALLEAAEDPQGQDGGPPGRDAGRGEQDPRQRPLGVPRQDPVAKLIQVAVTQERLVVIDQQ